MIYAGIIIKTFESWMTHDHLFGSWKQYRYEPEIFAAILNEFILELIKKKHEECIWKYFFK